MGKVLNHNDKTNFYVTWNKFEGIDRSKQRIETVLKELSFNGDFAVIETSCGVIVSINDLNDVAKVMNLKLTKKFGAVQISELPKKKPVFAKGLSIVNVPTNITLEDIAKALEEQGVVPVALDRKGIIVHIMVSSYKQYEILLRDGFNFFGVANFAVIADRNTKVLPNQHHPSNFILQCYRCQGWWHRADNCRYRERCVRCGDLHHVHDCLVPRSEPKCCHCAGPHTASYKFCPVRLELVNAVTTTISITGSGHSSH